MESLGLNPNPTSIPVEILHPTDIDPVELAYLSYNYQPPNCLVETAPVPIDYRNACKYGPSPRKLADSRFSCGELNPCCFDCRVFYWNCPNPPCGLVHTVDEYGSCADGVIYYSSGETEVDERHTINAPTVTAGEWTEEQRRNDNSGRDSNADASSGAAVGKGDWEGMGLLISCVLTGLVVIGAGVL